MKQLKNLTTLSIGLCAFTAIGQNVVPASGNVGIGTSTPLEKLQVNGKMRVDSSLTVMDSATFQSTLRVEQNGYIEGDLEVTGVASFLNDANFHGNVIFPNYIDAGLTVDRMLLMDNNGVLKVGNLNLDDIGDDIYKKDCFPKYDVNNNAWYQAPSWVSEGGPNIGDPKLYTGFTCPARVGIGTNDPLEILDVRGKIITNDALSINGGSYAALASNTFFQINGSTSNNDFFLFQNNNGINVKMDATGYVNHKGFRNGGFMYYLENTATNGQGLSIAAGDGANSPYEYAVFEVNTFENGSPNPVLRVNGKSGITFARTLKVNLDAWPDYVFDSTYHLKPLSEVETFIQTNRHLEGVPSEKEVLTDGVDVGEMNKILLQKIEELTLYLIEKDKELSAMKTELKALNDKVSTLSVNQN